MISLLDVNVFIVYTHKGKIQEKSEVLKMHVLLGEEKTIIN